MLEVLLPRKHRRVAAVPLVGVIADDFTVWLAKSGYCRTTLKSHVRFLTTQIGPYLRRQGVERLEEVTHEHCERFWHWLRHRKPDGAGVVRAFQRFLVARGALGARSSPRPTRSSMLLEEYASFLRDVRGFAPTTIARHLTACAELLARLQHEAHPARLDSVSVSDVEGLIKQVGRRLGRPSLQQFVGAIRGFLRFLTASGRARAGVDTGIDTPRVYRQEQLPRSLPWSTVEAFLRSIDRSATLGRRDYAMFSLITTYGLRTCEIVNLSLDDIDWRAEKVSIAPRKNRHPMVLPLTADVGEAIIGYLRAGRPQSSSRTLFLRHRAPAGVLKPTAVTEAFQAWARRSKLGIPFQGPHCLRHSYAVHLLRKGTSLKTIGDLLGHRSTESTCVYLRLATEDLRTVALTLPHNRRGRALKKHPVRS
jgi:site-specific recombinase XerD